jgi:NTP pyrophosphatase (non-canonical NTP hydrolase)
MERYEREFNFELARSLLFEEVYELNMARNEVEILDAVGDITFVFIGMLWKLNIDEYHITSLFTRYMTIKDDNETISKHIFGSALYINNISGQKKELVMMLIALALYSIFVVCYTKLTHIGMLDKFSDVLKIICDSNETKSVPKEKVSADIKANVTKGPNYVEPHKELHKLITGEL